METVNVSEIVDLAKDEQDSEICEKCLTRTVTVTVSGESYKVCPGCTNTSLQPPSHWFV